MTESRAEKTTWRAWAATALNEASRGGLDEANARRLFGVFETLAACIVMYCEPGEERQEALDRLVDSYGLASSIVTSETIFK